MSTSFWASTLPRFILFRSSTGNHGSWELMSTAVLLYPEDTTLFLSFLTFGSYNLSIPSSVIVLSRELWVWYRCPIGGWTLHWRWFSTLGPVFTSFTIYCTEKLLWWALRASLISDLILLYLCMSQRPVKVLHIEPTELPVPAISLFPLFFSFLTKTITDKLVEHLGELYLRKPSNPNLSTISGMVKSSTFTF